MSHDPEQMNALRVSNQRRKEEYKNLLEKFPNLQLSPEKFKAKMEFERIHKYKSQYFHRKDKVELVNKTAKIKFKSFAKDEFNPTVPKTPDYQKKRMIQSIESKIEKNTPQIKFYLHEGAMTKKPPGLKNSESVPDLKQKLEPRQTLFTDIISDASAPVKTEVRRDYYPEIQKKRGVDRRSSWKQMVKRKNCPPDEKYRQIMLASEHYKSSSAHYGQMNALRLRPTRKTDLLTKEQQKLSLQDNADQLFWKSVEAKLDLLDEFETILKD